MELNLFLFSIYDEEVTINILLELLKQVTQDIKTDLSESGEVYIYCNYFLICIEKDEIDNINDIKEEHDMDVNLSISIQVFNKTFDVGITSLLKFIGLIINKLQGDVLLLENFSPEILKRKDDVLFANIDFNSEYYRFPFNELGIPYVELKI
ncbi:hypothetical protein SAMN02745163_00945 [Clostridium cavendishii DSM 21758]|uniref:Uncharacterized protein n=1 Tax=Clostridium cavendishii DSM 21758 TaxID=1121302 RepID=A0A1M6EU21_9CLOT|nr:hypothetical protein [Clostridium cavendishii]SHI88965.1 hypothetical protein SAMN02745163_00945 [Clostridium cavendishii DSM 21758]